MLLLNKTTVKELVQDCVSSDANVAEKARQKIVNALKPLYIEHVLSTVDGALMTVVKDDDKLLNAQMSVSCEKRYFNHPRLDIILSMFDMLGKNLVEKLESNKDYYDVSNITDFEVYFRDEIDTDELSVVLNVKTVDKTVNPVH